MILRKKLFVNIARQVIVESINKKNQHIARVSNHSKKDPATRHARKTKLSFKSSRKYIRQIVYAGTPLL